MNLNTFFFWQQAKSKRDEATALSKRAEIAAERHLTTMSLYQEESRQVGQLRIEEWDMDDIDKIGICCGKSLTRS